MKKLYYLGSLNSRHVLLGLFTPVSFSTGLDIPKHGEPAYPADAYGHGWGEKGDSLFDLVTLAVKSTPKLTNQGIIDYMQNKGKLTPGTVLPAKSDRGVMFCLQSYQGRIIDRSRVY